MDNSEKPSSGVMEYFLALRAEIIEAQKLRVQVGLAKVVFLGSLFGFFLKDNNNVNAGILICPFVALMFDCMVYGLSFNIRDLGSYIGAVIEPRLTADKNVTFWQTYRTQRREKKGFQDWGRIMIRMGNYGLSIAAFLLSFWLARHPTVLISAWWLLPLGLTLGVGWGVLIWLEFFRRNPKLAVPQQSANPGPGG